MRTSPPPYIKRSSITSYSYGDVNPSRVRAHIIATYAQTLGRLSYRIRTYTFVQGTVDTRLIRVVVRICLPGYPDIRYPVSNTGMYECDVETSF